MEDAEARYRGEIEKLKTNDANIISRLSDIAREVKNTELVHRIADITCRHIFKVDSAAKLPAMYVLDSIVKTVGQPYVDIFAKNLSVVFESVFVKARDEAGRLKLFNLRNTWGKVFPKERLEHLDRTVKLLDPNWPVLHDGRSSKPESSASVSTASTTQGVSSSTASTKRQIASVDVSSSTETTSSRTAKAPVEDVAIRSTTIVDPRLNRDKVTSSKATSSTQPKVENRQALSKSSPAETVGSLQSYKEPPTQRGKEREGARNFLIDREGDSAAVKASQEKPVPIGRRSDLPPSRSSPKNPFVKPSPTNDLIIRQAELKMRDPNCTEAERQTLQRYLDELKRITATVQNSDNHRPLYGVPPSRPPPPIRPTPPRLCHPPLPLLTTRPRPPPVAQRWRVEIPGYDAASEIGVDPRLLSLVPHPKPPIFIRIDSRQYLLHLERLQPLVTENGVMRAVRFLIDMPIRLLIDGVIEVFVPPAGYTVVRIGERRFTACLGGPAHELILDGVAHSIPLRDYDQVTFINVDGRQVSVQLYPNSPLPKSVALLEPIPAEVLQFAAIGLFGNPRYLNLPPQNPLQTPSPPSAAPPSFPPVGNNTAAPFPAHDPAPVRPIPPFHRGFQPRMVPPGMRPSFPPAPVLTNPPWPPAVTNPTSSQPSMPSPLSQDIPAATSASSAPPTDISLLYRRLLEIGIIQQKTVKPEDIDLNCGTQRCPPSLDLLRKYNPTEVDLLFHGQQCVQCGQRFESTDSDIYREHLDYHYRKNSLDRSGTRHRNFYLPVQYWLMGALNMLQHDEDENDVECSDEENGDGEPHIKRTRRRAGPGDVSLSRQQEFRCKAFDNDQLNVCAVCKERFESVWDDEEEEWMLPNAMCRDSQVYHPVCLEDAGKVMSQEDQMTVATEETPVDSTKKEPESPTAESPPMVSAKEEPVEDIEEDDYEVCETAGPSGVGATPDSADDVEEDSGAYNWEMLDVSATSVKEDSHLHNPEEVPVAESSMQYRPSNYPRLEDPDDDFLDYEEDEYAPTSPLSGSE